MKFLCAPRPVSLIVNLSRQCIHYNSFFTFKILTVILKVFHFYLQDISIYREKDIDIDQMQIQIYGEKYTDRIPIHFYICQIWASRSWQAGTLSRSHREMAEVSYLSRHHLFLRAYTDKKPRLRSWSWEVTPDALI